MNFKDATVTISVKEFDTLRKSYSVIHSESHCFLYLLNDGTFGSFEFYSNEDGIAGLVKDNKKLSCKIRQLNAEIKKLKNKKWWEK